MSTCDKNRGFTLFELNTAVICIGILAAIAFPNYLRYQVETRSAQASLLLHAIAHRARVHQHRGRTVAHCGPTPKTLPTESSVPFEADDCWKDLGFMPSARVRFQLELRPGDGATFTVRATGDLDDDGQVAIYELSSEGDRVHKKEHGKW